VARLARNVAAPEAFASKTRSPGGLRSRISPAHGWPMLKCRPCDFTAQAMPKLALRDVPADLPRCSKPATPARRRSLERHHGRRNTALHEDPLALPERLLGETMSGSLLSPARPAPRQARALSSLGSARARLWAD